MGGEIPPWLTFLESTAGAGCVPPCLNRCTACPRGMGGPRYLENLWGIDFFQGVDPPIEVGISRFLWGVRPPIKSWIMKFLWEVRPPIKSEAHDPPSQRASQPVSQPTPWRSTTVSQQCRANTFRTHSQPLSKGPRHMGTAVGARPPV